MDRAAARRPRGRRQAELGTGRRGASRFQSWRYGDDGGLLCLQRHVLKFCLTPFAKSCRIAVALVGFRFESSSASILDMNDGNRREKALLINGAALNLKLDDDADLLVMHASPSDALRPTFTENCLSEPLRILFGQLIWPRFADPGTGRSVGFVLRYEPGPAPGD